MDVRGLHLVLHFQIKAEMDAMLALVLYLRQRRRRRYRWSKQSLFR